MLQKTFRPKTHLCWVVVGQKMEDVMDAEPPFRLLAGHYLYGQCFDHSYISKLRSKCLGGGSDYFTKLKVIF